MQNAAKTKHPRYLGIQNFFRAFLRPTKSVLPNSKFQIPDSSRGFTLIEVIIVIALMGVALVVLSELFIGQNRLYKSQTAELNATSGARTALDDIDSMVRSADKVADSQDIYTSGAQTLILQVPSVNSSSQIIPTTFDYVIYYLDSGNLYRLIQANAASSRNSGTKLLASKVTALNFGYNHITLSLVTEVTTDITITEAAPFSLSTKSKLRNN